MKISQFVAGMSVGDAITNYVFSLDRMMQDWDSVETDIYYIDEHVPQALKNKGKPFEEYRSISSEENIVVYHFANGSELAPFIRSLKDKKVMIYHNVTPGYYFEQISPERVVIQNEGRAQLKSLVGHFDLALGVSQFNCDELNALGFRSTGVIPLTLDEDLLNVKPSLKVINENQDHIDNIICVGRIAPNKKIEDVLRVMYYLQRTCDLNNRLFLVGSFGGMERYQMYLKNLIQELGLKRVVWSGHVSQSDLVAFYKIAKVFITMSEHEGFCVPIIEAMRFGVPVIARATSAIPETMGKEGVLFQGKNYLKIAELTYEVIKNQSLRQDVIRGQKNRIEHFNYDKIAQKWHSWIQKIL